MAKQPIRPIRIEGNLAYVTLTKGREAVIDATDVHLIEQHNWQANIHGYTAYAIGALRLGNGRQKTLLMHRIIMAAPQGLEVDHINGDGLDNRRSNLRLATRSENCRNVRMGARNSSGIKGVSWSAKAGKWYSHITVNNKVRHLGTFESMEAAAEAYAAASKQFHGEFGRAS